MLAFVFYLLKVMLCSSVFFLYYWLVLRNKRFHSYNRFYLLSSVVLSCYIPSLHITFFDNSDKPPLVIKLLSVAADSNNYFDEALSKATPYSWGYYKLFYSAFVLVSAAFAITLIATLIRIMLMVKLSPVEKWQRIKFVFTKSNRAPFSFFNYIFWNRQIDMSASEGNYILQHELVHVQQRHSADKLFINLVLVFGWFNPVFWFIRKELTLIHEFIADQKAIRSGSANDFAVMLLKAAYPAEAFSVTNSFFYSPIKRRLLMITNAGLPRFSYMRRLLILPLIGFVFIFFAFKTKNKTAGDDLYKLDKSYTVLIDAGHGGKDFGAEGADGSLEKDLNLQLAKLVKGLNTDNKINIVLSRQDDQYSSPHDRTALLEKMNADLFISLHRNNSMASSGNEENPRGGEIVISAKNNTFTRESTILGSLLSKNLEGVFKTVTPLTQKKVGIWVLDANNVCPSVLFEAGYISNPEDLKEMKDAVKEKEIANSILTTINQFFKYKEQQNKDELPTKMLPVQKATETPKA